LDELTNEQALMNYSRHYAPSNGVFGQLDYAHVRVNQ